MPDGPLRRLCWRVIDNLDYALMLARPRIRDALEALEPKKPADQQRERERERIERGFPKIAAWEDQRDFAMRVDAAGPGPSPL